MLGDPVVDDLAAFQGSLARWRRRRDEAGMPPGEVNAFVKALERGAYARFKALGVSRLVVNVPLDETWRRRLDEVLALASG